MGLLNKLTFDFIAHRGVSHLAPENSLAAIDLAWKTNCVAAECDIMLTKDNRVIVFHDDTLNRMTGVDLRVRDLTYEEVLQYPLRLSPSNSSVFEGQKIPLLSEVLASLPFDRTLVIEIKESTDIVSPLLSVVKEHWRTGRLAFIAFDLETIKQTKLAFPEIPCLLLAHDLETVNNSFQEMINAGLEGMDLNHKIIDEELVSRFHNEQKQIWCYTVNTVDELEKLRQLGVNKVTTNKPYFLAEYLNQDVLPSIDRSP